MENEPGGATQHLGGQEVADYLCVALRHLHGLTKPATRLVKLSASLLGTPPEAAGSRLAAVAEQLPRGDRTILREAIRLASGPLEPADPQWHGGTARARAMHGVAQRVAALVRLAEGIAALSDAEAGAPRVIDDAERLEILIPVRCVPPCDVVTDLEAAELWNRVALRPLQAVRFVSEVPVVPADPELPWLEAGRRIFLQQCEQMASREYGLGYAEDVEFVHEMRVATRRLRAAMRVFRKSAAGQFKAESARIGALADALGQVRDADVFLEFLATYGKKAKPAHRRTLKAIVLVERRKRQAGNRKLIALCESDSQRQFLHGLTRTLHAPVGAAGGLRRAGKSAKRPLWREARRAMRRAFSVVLQYDRPLQDLSSDEQHQLRIACKKLRYTAEFFGHLYPERLQTLIATMVRLQDLLGEAHDADVFSARLGQRLKKSAKGGGSRPRGVVIRAVQAHLKRRKQRCVAKAREVWQVLDRPEILSEMRALIEAPRKQ